MKYPCIMLHYEHDETFTPELKVLESGGETYCVLNIEGVSLFLTPKQVKTLAECLSGTSEPGAIVETPVEVSVIAPPPLEPEPVGVFVEPAAAAIADDDMPF